MDAATRKPQLTIHPRVHPSENPQNGMQLSRVRVPRRGSCNKRTILHPLGTQGTGTEAHPRPPPWRRKSPSLSPKAGVLPSCFARCKRHPAGEFTTSEAYTLTVMVARWSYPKTAAATCALASDGHTARHTAGTALMCTMSLRVCHKYLPISSYTLMG